MKVPLPLEGVPRRGGVGKIFVMKNRTLLTHINGIEIFSRKINALPKNKNLLHKARNLRKAGILSEVLFWQQVRNKQFHSIDFDRQRIIDNYIVDFYIKSLGVVIEIDGTSHNNKENYDTERDLYLQSLDLKVIQRIKNDLPNVMLELENFIIENFS